MNNISIDGLFSKFKNDKKSILILCVAALGLILILFPNSDSDKNFNTADDVDYSFLNREELCSELEGFIENINGAGKARVILTFESSAENVFASDENITTDSQGESEINREYIIVDNSGVETGIKIKIVSPKVCGIAVVCQGGDNPIIKEQIVSALTALFDISSNKISVAEMAR